MKVRRLSECQSVYSVGSLFSGIGGLELGLTRTGRFQPAYFVEKDEYACKVLRKHYPVTAIEKDVVRFPYRPIKDWHCDVLSAGFPCQDISTSGPKTGFSGKKSSLFFEVIRVARLLRPKGILLENVATMLDRGMDEVLWSLSEIGYDAEWHVVSCESVGGSHKRPRVFVLAYPSGARSKARISEEACGSKGYTGIPYDCCDQSSGWTGSSHWATEPNVGQLVDGFRDRACQLKALGNAVVPQCSEIIGYRLAQILDSLH
jgi:DNA (cytosine-5)-methyltransferase 1